MKNYTYLKIYAELRDQIIHGAYPLHSTLHSKRILAKEFGVSRITIEHALNLLKEEGYIESLERVGYKVIYNQETIFPVSNLIDTPIPTTIKENKIPYSIYAKAVRTVLTIYGEKVLEKSPMQGLYELRVAIKNYLARSRNLFVDEEQIVIGAGSESFYSRIVELFGRSIVYGVEYPGYEKVEKEYLQQGVRVDRLKLGNDGLLQTELQRTPAKILHVTPFISYPSLVTASASKRRAYLEWANKNDAILVEDDYASEFISTARVLNTLFSLDTEGRVLYINSFHKTISSSLRMGYIVLPKQKVKTYLNVWKHHSCQVSTLDQLIVTYLLNSGAFERNLNRLRRRHM